MRAAPRHESPSEAQRRRVWHLRVAEEDVPKNVHDDGQYLWQWMLRMERPAPPSAGSRSTLKRAWKSIVIFCAGGRV